VGELTPVSSE